ncbi:formylglycine-generating enzyme family protein [Nitrospina gracilis]|uniref:formylglycine-generating enzyme family protein n=1 Tax=Nitrospina gracilis TaxID=35801 RepID=UPI001F27ACF4|nr:formylglycine-generating enzyme family protein [Nitrospina gracilis]MCF8719753.1 iron(II)-dependent oxidoreductase [Nitrospina gracilis Nb-211]
MNPEVQEPHPMGGCSGLGPRAWGRILIVLLLACGLFACASSGSPNPSPGMVHVPAGPFTMGSSEEDIQWAAKTFFSESLEYYRDETPAYTVQMAAFEIDQHEVTNAEYRKYLEATNRPAPKYLDNEKFNAPNQPVAGVTWQEANDYCAWTGKRLPTEAEWEKAARGVDGRFYPWGNDPDPTRANARGMKDGHRYPAPVGTFPKGASPYGALDMAGNVWEWTADWYRPYPGNLVKNDLYGNTFRVMRGGSWFSNMDLARSTVRGKLTPDQRQNYIGFRCAR